MLIAYDEAKRQKTLVERNLDFADAKLVFTSKLPILTIEDDRNHTETRWQTMGFLNGRLVMIVWTNRGHTRRIISMRKCNDKEKGKYYVEVG